MRISTSRASRIWLLCCAIALLGGPIAAQFSNPYHDGVTAFEEGRWEDAVRSFREAIQENPEERRRRVKLPWQVLHHFYLGRSLSRMGDCSSALMSFQESLDQGFIRKTDHFGTLLDERRRCEAVLALRALQETLKRAQAAAVNIEPLSRDPDLRLFWRQTPVTLERLVSASNLLARYGVYENYDLDELDLLESTALREGRGELERTILLFGEIDREVDVWRAETAKEQAEQAKLSEARDALGETEEQARELLSSARGRDSEAGLASRKEIQKALASPVPPSVESMADRGRLLLELIETVKNARKLLPPILRTVATDFLDGEYESVIESLQDFTLKPERETAHALLLRAAAHFTLDLLRTEETGDRDHALAARGDVLASLRADSRLEPIAEMFSPRFILFFDRLKEEGEEESLDTAGLEE